MIAAAIWLFAQAIRKSPDFSAWAVNSVGDNPALSASALIPSGLRPSRRAEGSQPIRQTGANVEINQMTAVLTGIGER
ncbi:hypothetical protein ACLB1M_12670 [Escherichia coli]